MLHRIKTHAMFTKLKFTSDFGPYDQKTQLRFGQLEGGLLLSHLFKDTHREKTPSNKTPALRKSTNMSVWAVGTLN